MKKQDKNKAAPANTPAPAPLEIMVAVSKTTTKKNGATIERTNALLAPQVSAVSFASIADVEENFCLNLLAGNLSAEIVEAATRDAAGERGVLKNMFPKFSNATVQALRYLAEMGYMANDPKMAAKLREHWQAEVDRKKRVHSVKLQPLYLSTKEKEEKEEKVTLREALAAWAAASPKQVKELPVKLFDLFVDYDLIGDGEGK